MIRLPRLLMFAVFILLVVPGIRPALAQVSQFTVNADGTVTDSVTGLIWDRCSWGQSGDTCATGAASTHTWPQALAVAVTANAMNSGAGYKGHTDWRLPSLKELESLVDIGRSGPAINTTAFPNTPSNWYWSSTPYTPVPALAWGVDFGSGFTYAYGHDDGGHVRLVRRGQSFDTFAVRGGGAVSIPTLSEWTLALLVILLGGMGQRARKMLMTTDRS